MVEGSSLDSSGLGALYPIGAVKDPTGAASGKYRVDQRVLRGICLAGGE